MKRIYLLVLALAILTGLAWLTIAAPPRAGAFDHAWTVTGRGNVLPGDLGIWDDVASGMTNDEAALLWAISNDSGLEGVEATTTDIAINTSSYPTMTVRADLSDNGELEFGYSETTDGPCGYLVSLRYASTDAPKGYLTKSYKVPSGKTIRKVCIKLEDAPNSIDFGRTNALITWIRFTNAKGKIGWREEFSGAP